MRFPAVIGLLGGLSAAVSCSVALAQGAAQNPFGRPDAEWVTTGRGMACPSASQLRQAQQAIGSGDISHFHDITAGCVSPEAGFEVQIVAPGSPAKLLLILGSDPTGPWYADRAFFGPGRGAVK